MSKSYRMVGTLLLAVVATTGSFCVQGCGGNDPHEPRPMAFVHAALFDGKGTRLEDATLVIRGNTIEAVGKTSDVPLPSGAEVVDLRGQTLMPGIINAHVHDSLENGTLERWAKAGVTTVRDGHVSPELESSLLDERRGMAADAQVIAAGSMLTAKGGYPAVPWGWSATEVEGPEDARTKTESVIARGADFIKIALESGTIMGAMPGAPAPPWPTLNDEEIAAIVATAHAHRLRVAAHVTFSGDLARAARAGVDDVMHMVADPIDDDLLGLVVERKIAWTPTLELWNGFTAMAGPQLLLGVQENLRRFASAGGKVVLGTDFAGADVEFEQGMPLTELRLMREAGLTPDQVLVAATGAAAEACDAQGAFGTLEVGSTADVLVVPGDPFEDLSVLGKPTWVLREGQPLVHPRQ